MDLKLKADINSDSRSFAFVDQYPELEGIITLLEKLEELIKVKKLYTFIV